MLLAFPLGPRSWRRDLSYLETLFLYLKVLEMLALKLQVQIRFSYEQKKRENLAA